MDEIDWKYAPHGTHRYISGDSKFSAKWLMADVNVSTCLVWEVIDGTHWHEMSPEEWKDMHGKHQRTMLKPPIPVDVIYMRKAIKEMIEDSDYSILECQAEALYQRGYRKVAS